MARQDNSVRLSGPGERDYFRLSLHKDGGTGYLWLQEGDRLASRGLSAAEIETLRLALNRHHRQQKASKR